jgi:hypothetical protein
VRFDPQQLRPEASLNATRLAEVPGTSESLVGRRAGQVLSLNALVDLGCHIMPDLAEEPHDSTRVSWLLAEALVSPEPARRHAARHVVRAYAQRLAHLIATVTGAQVEPEATSWRKAYLRHWSGVERVCLGGGIAAALGTHLAGETNAELRRLGRADLEIQIASHAVDLALLGGARSLPLPRQPHRVVLDFGGSTAKRGIAKYKGARVEQLEVLPARTTPTGEADHVHAQIVEFVLEVIIETLELARERLADVGLRAVDRLLHVSLACYVWRGRPLDKRGTYLPLSYVAIPELERRVRERTSFAARLRFQHDGTAAARALEHRPRTGLIVLGTFLGVGFPAVAESVLPISREFVVTRPNRGS